MAHLANIVMRIGGEESWELRGNFFGGVKRVLCEHHLKFEAYKFGGLLASKRSCFCLRACNRNSNRICGFLNGFRMVTGVFWRVLEVLRGVF